MTSGFPFRVEGCHHGAFRRNEERMRDKEDEGGEDEGRERMKDVRGGRM